MKQTLIIVLILAFALCCIFPLFSESGTDDSDEVFENPPDDTLVPETSPANPVDRFTTQGGIRLSGSFDAYGGLLVGWADWPDPSDPGKGFSKSPVASISTSLSFDARPVSYFRVWGTLSMSYPDASSDYAQLSGPTIGELFCDYSVADVLFFRIGKQVVNWGAARFFAIDNLPARVPTGFQIPLESFDGGAAGIGLKVNIPFGVHSLTTFMQIKNGYLRPSSTPNLSEVGYGILGELLFGKTELSIGGYYQQYLRPRALITAKTSFFGIDAQAETIIAYTEGPGIVASWVGNLFWEQPDVGFRIAAEYIYNAETGQPYVSESQPGFPTGHAIACLAGFREVFGTKIDMGVQWEHAFLDNSGIVIPAVVFKPFGYVSITCGVPLVYGPASSEIMNINPDPENRRTSLGLRISISGTF